MTLASAIRRRLALLVRGEEGIALPVALLATTIGMALAGVAVMSTVDVQSSSHRDSSAKSAIAAADAGVSVALLRLKRDQEELAATPCLGGETPSSGWCPTVYGEVGGAEYAYRISAYGTGEAPCEYAACIVSAGTAGGVSRRVEVALSDKTVYRYGTGGGGGGSEGVIGAGDVTIDSEAEVRTGVGTNGEVLFPGQNANICGDVRHGVGTKATEFKNNTQCAGYTESEEDISLPSVESFMPSDLATNNADSRLVTCTSKEVPKGCQEDTYTGKWKGGEPWNPETRTLRLANNTTLTLGGEIPYFICRLELKNNSHLVMPVEAEVQIYFDTPEHCGIAAGENQIFVAQNANIESTAYQPDVSQYALPALYVMGSPTIETNIEWAENTGGGGTNEIYLYAPNSHIELRNNNTFLGKIVGKTVHIRQNVRIEQGEHKEGSPESEPKKEEENVPIFSTQYYVECTGVATTTPDSGC